MRRLLPLTALVGVSLHSAAPASPAFVPSPKQAFDGFVAINAPRPDVPVGALWIDGYGPVGAAAGPDNLETVRSLNGMTIDKGFQVNLSLGLLQLLGIDPRFRDRLTARFTDLAIVRVKDIAKLAGPKGEPRIIEAIKAASIVVSSDGELGLNGRSVGWNVQDIDGQGTSGRTRSFSIEGRDMFIAIRVATHELVRGPEQELDLHPAAARDLATTLEDYEVRVRDGACDASLSGPCPSPSFSIVKLSTHPAEAPTEHVAAAEDGDSQLSLPVPVADDRGGLFDAVRLRWIPACAVRKADGCRKRPRLFTQFIGTRLTEVKRPQAHDWF